jgi:hypothetical protein
MIETFMNLNITRAIPQEVLTGLITRQYSLHGGVIRWAAGTEQAGQIIRHLVPVAQQTLGASLFAPISSVFGAVNTYQLHKQSGQLNSLIDTTQQLSGQMSSLTTTTQQVLSVANSTMILSGLNLAVTAVGFVMLNEKLKNLEGKLNEIQRDVKAIRALLEREERSKLAAAMRDLLSTTNVEKMEEKHRYDLLLNAKNILAPIGLKYKELLEKADSIETAMAYEEYFCLTSLAHVRCLADMGMLSTAHDYLQETYEVWKKQAQRIARNLLLDNKPERFLFGDYCQNIPVAVLIEWFDFTYGEEKGYGWVDELRIKNKSWHSDSNDSLLEKGLLKTANDFFGSNNSEKIKQKSMVIQSIKKLIARNNVLNGFVAQYELFEKHNITPLSFERKITSLPSNVAVDGYIILQPKN